MIIRTYWKYQISNKVTQSITIHEIGGDIKAIAMIVGDSHVLQRD